jgi:hypothetical protein
MIFIDKHLSDVEYVERVRKRIRSFEHLRWIWPVLLVGVFVLLCNLGVLLHKCASLFSVDQAGLLNGLILGTVIGVVFGTIAIQTGLCLKNWNDARRGFRTERLMLRLYDDKRERETSNKHLEHISDSANAV